MLKPLSGINILDFLKDILSAIKSFPKDKLEKYKIFIALLNLPKEFLENKKILDFIYPHENVARLELKRKHESESDNEIIKKKKKINK